MAAGQTRDPPSMDCSSVNIRQTGRALGSIDCNALFSGAKRRGKIADLRELGISMNSRRGSSINSHPIRGIASACIDADDSGTYDPNESHVAPTSSQPKRAKKAKTVEGVEDKDQAGRAGEAIEKNEKGTLVNLTFHSTKGLEVLKSLSPSPGDDSGDESPEASESDDPDTLILSTKRQSIKPTRLGEQESKNSGFMTHELAEDDPRRWGCKSCFDSGDDHCSLINNPYTYPCAVCSEEGIDCEPIITPELKRACQNCKKKRLTCSYRVDGGKGIDSCTSCKRLGLDCFAGTLRPSQSKKLQETDEFKTCPATRRKATSQPQIATPARKYIACNQCRIDGVRCSLKKHQTGPCKNCRLSHESCEFEPVSLQASQKESNYVQIPASKAKGRSTKKKASNPKKQAKNKRQTHHLKKGSRQTKKHSKGKSQSHSRRRRRRPSPDPPSTGGIWHTTIRTSYAHPIIFNYIPAPDGSSPCHWCSSPFFGLFGHGWRIVEVLPLADGHGYEEIGQSPEDTHGDHSGGRNINTMITNMAVNKKNFNQNVHIPFRDRAQSTYAQRPRQRPHDLRGWAQLGEPRSQMCYKCTSARVRIISCFPHKMAVLEDIFDGEERGLLGGDAHAVEELLQSRACSICPNFAEYECVAARDVCGMDCECEEGAVQCAVRGCGLKVCADCMHFMKGVAREPGVASGELRVLDEVVRIAQSDGFHYEEGIRADAGFLTTGGELFQRVMRRFGREEEKEREEDGKGKGIEFNREVIDLVEEDSDSDDDTTTTISSDRSPARKRLKGEIPLHVEAIEISDDEV